jgi:exodeoxyribonuclease VII small subunit
MKDAGCRMAKTIVAIEKLNYEQALSELEKIVQQLENQSLELDVTLKMFERGKLLIQRCQSLLDHAELKVRQLSVENPKTEEKNRE